MDVGREPVEFQHQSGRHPQVQLHTVLDERYLLKNSQENTSKDGYWPPGAVFGCKAHWTVPMDCTEAAP